MYIAKEKNGMTQVTKECLTCGDIETSDGHKLQIIYQCRECGNIAVDRDYKHRFVNTENPYVLKRMAESILVTEKDIARANRNVREVQGSLKEYKKEISRLEEEQRQMRGAFMNLLAKPQSHTDLTIDGRNCSVASIIAIASEHPFQPGLVDYIKELELRLREAGVQLPAMREYIEPHLMSGKSKDGN